MAATIETPLTKLFKVKHPVILAGMNVAAGPELAAAVTNAGGLGVIGGYGYTPAMLREQIAEIKSFLVDKSAPFGVDLLLPQVGGNARKTNYDYTNGELPELINVVISEKAALFVSAVGVPPKWVVEKLHQAGIPVMNMVGAPKHVMKAIEAGVDIICAQGGEGGGHTGDVPTSVLIPKVVDICKGHKSSLTGGPIQVVAAGGIFDGRGLAMSLCLGASAVWVGTRFICAKEAGAPKRHQEAVLNAGYHDTYRTTIYTGRPMRILKNWYASDWEDNRQQELKKLLSEGKVPAKWDAEKREAAGANEEADFEKWSNARPLLMGQVAGAVDSIKPAKEIVEEMVRDAVSALENNNRFIQRSSKL
ncbi:2-nitropropane dioxygenase [Rhizoclosmatium globosum]|uniref:2-nitropropane dioxygenase n=1 Tax=Rhizoclosmatium globosum TaxID=329046 RepID=A0A1Y2CEJ6_9FUNG|nr:2-nitropropane dioxygenase [Rhizoclosmatium globosum]|eukprot:ORY45234.1 2-nitropropane dioxygenase [Rhizoclosmatium globosum]